ncbi:MAG: hypothetical protein RBR88_05545 [Candidatus Saccharicenans sp.]|nr:hypothetical protein [Candidatus Saccharicenans sp.]
MTELARSKRKKAKQTADRVKNLRLGRNPFTEEPLSFIRDTTKEPGRKRGRPKGSGSKGPGLWKRATFIVRQEYLDTLKKLAYQERVTATELVDRALGTFLEGKRIKKQAKETKKNVN